MAEERIVIEDVIVDLRRVQDFDPKALVQIERLGQEFSFESAVEPARRLVALFRKFPASAVGEFAVEEIKQIQAQAKSAYNLFEEILNFSSREVDAETRHTQLVENIETSYQKHFSRLFPFISFAVAREVDFNELSEQGRAVVQTLKDDAEAILSEINETSKSTQRVLEEVRSAAAEEGVTRQAIYFAKESEVHDGLASEWRKYTFVVATVVVIYSISTLFFPIFPFLQADSLASAIQITSSKILIFAVLVYVLFLCVKNFLAHKHNSIVNKHRQNALMTYTTLVESGQTLEARDIVLQHAAAAIYSPGDTGYVRNEERGYNGGSVPGFIPRSGLNSVTGGDG